jgi:hypothetical protein
MSERERERERERGERERERKERERVNKNRYLNMLLQYISIFYTAMSVKFMYDVNLSS